MNWPCRLQANSICPCRPNHKTHVTPFTCMCTVWPKFDYTSVMPSWKVVGNQHAASKRADAWHICVTFHLCFTPFPCRCKELQVPWHRRGVSQDLVRTGHCCSSGWSGPSSGARRRRRCGGGLGNRESGRPALQGNRGQAQTYTTCTLFWQVIDISRVTFTTLPPCNYVYAVPSINAVPALYLAQNCNNTMWHPSGPFMCHMSGQR